MKSRSRSRRPRTGVISRCHSIKWARHVGRVPRLVTEVSLRADGRREIRLARCVHIFWVDERRVPPTDSASNYKLAKEYLIDPAGIPEAQVHRVLGEIAPEDAATRYADDIRAFFGRRQARCQASM
jgi:6-phosphogluconolactonase/glucosamine-6-phosphate isomerase/deaminase